MDEPFGAVDPVNRAAIQAEFLNLQRRLAKTVIFVSHDVDEALLLGTRIAIMRKGRLVQCDTPEILLAHPADPFVAAFVGEDRVLRRLGLMSVADALLGRGHPLTLSPDDGLSGAAALMERHGQSDLVVVDREGCVTGLMRLETARNGGKDAVVADGMEPLLEPLRPEDDLRTAATSMLAQGRTALPCIDHDGRLAGYVTPEGIGRALSRGEEPRDLAQPAPSAG